jgi:hypothetical protein
MDVFDRNPTVGGGGAARGGGGFYHLSFRSGSRVSGVSALAAYDYATRQEEYGGPDLDPAVYTESGNMPSWAEGDPAEYWEAADDFERANGRLYVAADFALPRDLSAEDQIELAREFARELTEKEQLPYTLAIHAGLDEHGHSHNPHAHLMFSERRNDGIDRSRDQWFRRANSEHPERGGAPKSRTFHGPEWIEKARERLADKTNATLERCGREERVDHRSYERQGVERNPGEHYGPAAAHMVSRCDSSDRLGDAAVAADDAKALEAVDHEIARLEAAREALLREGPEGERDVEPRDYSRAQVGDRGDDRSWGR